MYDATGVRRHSGMQAEVLNMIVENLFKGIPSVKESLRNFSVTLHYRFLLELC